MAARYLGNRNKYEIHDLWNTKDGCQIEEIKPENRVEIETEKEVARLCRTTRWDGCHHCLRRYHTG